MTIFDDIGDAFTDAGKAVTGAVGDATNWLGNDSSMNARSIEVSLVNKTKSTLYWDDSGLDHGTRKTHAPDEIAPGAKGQWKLESNGFKTGVEGWMNWTVGKGGPMLKLEYDNPYVGANSYSCKVDSSKYTVERDGGKGDHADVVFTVA